MKQMFRSNTLRRRLSAAAAGLLSAALLLCGTTAYYAHALPDRIFTDGLRPLSVSAALPVTVTRMQQSVPQTQEAELRLFGILPVKTVALTTLSDTDVILGGEPFGIRMLMAGTMVVSLTDVSGENGRCCPAEEAGLQVGDVIRAVNGSEITGNADLQEIVSKSNGSPVRVCFLRAGTEMTVSVQPAYVPLSSRWQIGMWVRDAVAGIGTVTYYAQGDSGAMQFAGLGHAVCDADTGMQIPLASGDVIPVDVTNVIPGSAGLPGELRGVFDTAHSIGTLLANTPCGVFGTYTAHPKETVVMPLGFRQDIRRGAAQIYTTLHGDTPRAYDVEIEEIRGNDAAMRNLVIRVTDSTLLSEAGGIVQGMSGSPIVQNGRLIGAVTHVFLRDPTRGYGIFAENMYAQTASFAGVQSPAAAAKSAAGDD